VAPQASITDGYLDLITVRDMPVFKRAFVLNDVRAGRHIGRRGIAHLKVRSARIVFKNPPLVNLDGELLRAPSPVVSLECAPARLRVAIP
jgi:diacylglycerol kinase family enzyme